ncbi:transposase [Vibrio sp. DW001]|uniref:transposase n=1 Tax=Vibrio sp. DW001 TaxID=2912315 RepID=UPI0023B09842|nr:transposase [Vibrio sp. DW001]WED25641.1 transposase [Vibrio sp. DW001]
MTTARKQLVSIESTPYYHCVSRCVRRSFLCGVDPYTQQSYEHRRAWIESKIEALSQLYCIDICAYAIMSNHYHLVLHMNRDEALGLSSNQVIERWQLSHKLPALIQRWLSHQITTGAEEKECLRIIESWRNRLWDLSWFMKELNYDIALKANQEDNCKGHFWECRFKNQALLDEQALLAAMAYVDLNPLKAGIAEKPETSEFTSIKVRLQALKEQKEKAHFLFPFVGNSTNKIIHGIPLRLVDYIELVDWTARQYRENKATLKASIPPILQRLGIAKTTWLKACTQLERYGVTAVGCHCHAKVAKLHMKKVRIHLFRLDN